MHFSESEIIKMPAGAMSRELIFRFGGVWILALSLTALVGLVAGIVVDLRWFIAGLMLIFVVLPMLVSFLYYYYGLRKECFINTAPHTLTICDEGIRVTLLEKISKDEADDREVVSDGALPANIKIDMKDGNISFETSQIRSDYEERMSEFFPYSSMKPYIIGHKSAIIPLKSPLKGFIWIPADAYPDEEELANNLKFIDNAVAAQTSVTYENS